LKRDERNVRRHNPKNIGLIVKSLQDVGAARSIVVDEDGVVLAGNGVIEAAGIVGIERVRVVEASGDEIIAVRRVGLSEEQKRRLALYDNRASDLSEWDARELLGVLEEDESLRRDLAFIEREIEVLKRKARVDEEVERRDIEEELRLGDIGKLSEGDIEGVEEVEEAEVIIEIRCRESDLVEFMPVLDEWRRRSGVRIVIG